MAHRWLPKPKGLVSMPLLLLLGVAMACGAAATPTPQAKATPIPLPVATKAAPAQATATPGVAAAPTATKAAPAATAVPVATPKPSPTPLVVAQPKFGGHVPMIAAATVSQWDPHKSPSLIVASMQNAPLYNKLVEYNPETDDQVDLRGDLAKSWEVSKDGATYTFRLHENIRWWDGKPITAADVVFSLDRIVQPGEFRPWSGQLKPYYKSSRAIDDKTVQVEIPFNTPLFLLYLALETNKVLPKHVLEAGLDISKLENIVGSGPFKVKKHLKDVSLEFTKNPDYFKQGYPRIDGMTQFIIVDHGTVIAAFKTGQVLMCSSIVCNLDVDEAQKLVDDSGGKLKLLMFGPGGMRGLMINTKVKPFDDVRVRHALHLALDRQSYNQTLNRGVNYVGAPFPPYSWFGRTLEEVAQLPGYRQLSGEKHPADLTEARKLLAEAGYPNGFKTTLKVIKTLDYVDAAQLVAQQLRKTLKIDATVMPGETGTLYTQYGRGDYELSVQGDAMLVFDPSSVFGPFYLENGSRNYSHWRSDKIEDLFQRHIRETDQEKRKLLVREAEDYLINVDSQWVGLDWPLRPLVHEIRIKNYRSPAAPVNELMWEHIYCDPKC